MSYLLITTSTTNETEGDKDEVFVAEEIPKQIRDLVDMESVELSDVDTLDILNHIDKILCKILVSPKQQEQGNMIFTLTSLYFRIMDKLEVLITNFQVNAFDVVMAIKKQGGPQFLGEDYNMPLYRERFNWCRYNITRFKELMSEALKKWRYMDALVREND